MVLYSAPEDDDRQTTPMEWTIIPDDDCEEIMMSDSFNRFSLGSSQSSRDHEPTSSFSTKDNDGNAGGREIICLSDSTSQDGVDFGHDKVTNPVVPPMILSAGEFYNSLRTMHDDYVQDVNHQLLQQQHHNHKRRRRLCSYFAALLILVAFILYRYAPPPPPLKISLPSNLSGKDSDIGSIIRDFMGMPEYSNSATARVELQQHDSWSSYCKDTSRMFLEASLHQISVFWYAVSNAFAYAVYEVRIVVINYVKRSFQSEAGETSKTGDNQLKQNAFTQSWCPIRIPAASNYRFSLPKGANTHTSESANTNNFLGLTTEDYLRQSIGASLSPQNLAISLIAEGIDIWGMSLIEAAEVPLVHRMSAAMETGLWTEEHKEYNNTQWILPATKGVLLVGPEGVGKLHTARILGDWLFGHCRRIKDENPGFHEACATSLDEEKQYCSSDITTNDREGSFSYQKLSGVLQLTAEEYANHHHDGEPIKEKIVNHIYQRQSQGSVVILHLIEMLPLTFLTELFHVVNGKSQHISYTKPDGVEVTASTNGIVFVFTSKQWGTKHIFKEIQKNGIRTNGLRRDSLLNSIKSEVDSHFKYSKMADVSLLRCRLLAAFLFLAIDLTSSQL